MIMERLTQNILRLCISAALLTIPIGSLFVASEYLGYKNGIAKYVEDLSTKYDDLLEKLKEISPELKYYID